MNLLTKKFPHPHPLKSLTSRPTHSIYIHLKDHDQKINPKQNRLTLSYMDPKLRTDVAPTHPKFAAKLRKGAFEELQRKLFEVYKQKIMEGTVDEEKVVEPDPLWGDGEVPVHYYRELAGTQVGTVGWSIVKDLADQRQQLVKSYLSQVKDIKTIGQYKDVNDLAHLAVNLRQTTPPQRQTYHQIEQSLHKNFHNLTPQSLILLKHAFFSTPKTGSPQLNHILNDLLTESIQQLSVRDLTFLMFFNRFDHFRFYRDNLQITVLEAVSRGFVGMGLRQKIDFLFLFVDSRGPTIRREAHNRSWNQVRNKAQEILYYLNIQGDFMQLSEQSILKLTYSLVRAKTNATQHLTDQIVQYLQKNLQKISPRNTILFLSYLTNIQSGKSISNIPLLQSLKQKAVSSWSEYTPLQKVRALDAMLTVNLYDQVMHELYKEVPIGVDSTLLGYFCRIQMVSSSGREWEVIHRLVDLSYIPLIYFKDCKRFYNYVKAIAPDWNLQPLHYKLQNTETFHDSLREQSRAMDIQFYRQLRQFQKFSGLKGLPHKFKMGQAIANVQFAQFMLPEYQISIDVINDVECVKGTRDLKAGYVRKIKNLQCLGWKHLYVFEQDISKLHPIDFFNHIHNICQPHFQQQLSVISTFDEYRSYQLKQLRQDSIKALLKPKQYELYLEHGDLNLIKDDDDLEEELNREKMKKIQQKATRVQELVGGKKRVEVKGQ